MGRVYEQIPHPKIAYAYIAFEAETWNEFEKLRSEGLKKHPLYGPSAFEQPTRPENVVAVAVAESTDVVQADPPVQPVEAPAEPAATAPTGNADQAPSPTTQGLSARDKAKAAMAAKKGA